MSPVFPFRLLALPLGAVCTFAQAQSPTLEAWFSTPAGKREDLPVRVKKSAPMTRREADRAVTRTWEAYRAGAVAQGWDKVMPAPLLGEDAMTFVARAADAVKAGKSPVAAAELPAGKFRMPFVLLGKGDQGPKGWPLFISMHGGGSTEEPVGPDGHGWLTNTREWWAQMRLFGSQYSRPGLYFIPRMAHDNHGRWYTAHNHEAFDLMLRTAILFRGVDPDRVHMMGISEGGYGTDKLAPFFADRLASACAMAAASGRLENLANLANTPFRTDMGEFDTAYGRISMALDTHAALGRWKAGDDRFTHVLAVQPGRGHGINYAPGAQWVGGFTRNPRPTRVTWNTAPLEGARRDTFYWLGLEGAPAQGSLTLDATLNRDHNTVLVHAAPQNGATLEGATLKVFLDDRMLDLDKPVTVVVNGKVAFRGSVARRLEHIARRIAERGDPSFAFPGEVRIPLGGSGAPAPGKP